MCISCHTQGTHICDVISSYCTATTRKQALLLKWGRSTRRYRADATVSGVRGDIGIDRLCQTDRWAGISRRDDVRDSRTPGSYQCITLVELQS